MVIVKIWGGLGNQMFQFAAAKALSEKNNVLLKLDISHFNKTVSGEARRKYRLDIFPNIKEEFASPTEIKKMLPRFKMNLINKVYKNFNQKILNFNKSYKVERSFSYSEINLHDNKSAYLDGYWQAEKYFNIEPNLIKKIFCLDYLDSNTSLKSYVKKIKETTSVSIHVRRGDYVTNRYTNSHHGVIKSNYYAESIKNIVQLTSEDLTFFIFSDDIDWCKKNIKISYEHVYITTPEDYFDLYLMSICKHNIIANSSFSWWAAWLNKYDKKVVIAPEKWFSHKVAIDIIPPSWIIK